MSSVENLGEKRKPGKRCGFSTTDSDLLAPVHFESSKLKRNDNSSFGAETINNVQSLDVGIVVQAMAGEILYGRMPNLVERLHARINEIEIQVNMIKMKLYTDAKDFVDRVKSIKSTMTVSKRRRSDIVVVQDLQSGGELAEIIHICGQTNPLDVGTKQTKLNAPRMQIFLKMITQGTFIPDTTGNNDADRNCYCIFCRL